MTTFYITTAIDYVNSKPHVGHAYEKIISDVLARWHRLLGEDVYFLTGTDENAQKNAQAAQEAKIDTKTFEKRHVQVAQQIFEELSKKGDIYKGMYEGLYCYGCEAYYNEKDLVDGKCPEHNKAPTWIKQESYFFKISKYEKQVLKLVKSKNFILPESKRNEIVQRLETDGLKDLCVSRYGAEWGIEVPFDRSEER